MHGKRKPGRGIKAKPIEQVASESRIFRTGQPRIITADTQIGGREVPAALNLAENVLFFGFKSTSKPPEPASSDKPKENGVDENKPPPAPFEGVQGTGNTLSGRAPPPSFPTTPASTSTSAASASASTSSSSAKGGEGGAFSGKGNRLRSDVIEID